MRRWRGQFSGVNRLVLPQVLPTHTKPLFDAAVRRVVSALRAGEVVALPTETVYGLAANAFDARAVEKIFAVKGRPSHNPIIVHVADHALARCCVRDWPAAAERLAAAFWPGALTLVLPRSARVPDVVTAGGETVGIRWPSHPFIQAVIRECGFPLAAPSANVSNEISPTNAEHVRRGLGGRIGLIVDGGQAQLGIESAVVDVTVTPPRVLRPGMIHEGLLRAALGGVGGAEAPSPASETPAPALRSPGQLPKHYSPKARVAVLHWRDEADLLEQAAKLAGDLSRVQVMAHSCIPSGERVGGVRVIPHDAEAFARALYAEWHRCDEEGAEWILVEAPPEGPEWRGIADRLRRAAG